jgi:hypothetical protein
MAGALLTSDTSQGIDILAAVFFAVAGIWLLIAMAYSGMIILFLRMRARGQLDTIYDEEFGRIYLPWTNERFYVPTGCLFRRYMHHLQEQQRTQSSQPSLSAETDAAAVAAARYMTTEERREAMEVLLWEERDTQKTVHSKAAPVPAPESSTDTGTADNDLEEGPMCLICLDEFIEKDSTVLHSRTCSHLYHKDCIMDWLQRHGTRKCPCCRVSMITEDEVWETVQRLRKEKRKQVHRETKWWFMFRRESPTKEESESGNNSVTEDSENSSDDDDVMMVSPTLTADTASSEEEDAESPADANV